MFSISDKKIGDGNPCFIIAEAGSNHNGNIEQAKKLVDIAVAAGVDAVKFQTFTGDKLFAKYHPANEIVKKYEFKLEWHREIKSYCDERGIIFMTTPFQKDAVDLLEELNVPAYKIASGDMDYYPLLDYVAKTEKPVILATGIAYMEEVAEAVERLKSKGAKDVVALHCVANYPPRDMDINLSVIPRMKEVLGIPVGYSDHSMGIAVPIAAVAMGADVIEKHFTISRELEGMDHFYALEPEELKQMVEGIRRVEAARGDGLKRPVEGERAERHFARRGIVASKALPAGHVLEASDLDYVRPVDGIDSRYFEMVIGKTLKSDLAENEAIAWTHLG